MPLKRRPQPFRLAAKLATIRQRLGLTPQQLAKRFYGLKSPPSARKITSFESGQLEPTLFEILAYARLASVSTDTLIDDKLDLGDSVISRRERGDSANEETAKDRSVP